MQMSKVMTTDSWSCVRKNLNSQYLSQPRIVHSQQSTEKSQDNLGIMYVSRKTLCATLNGY